MNGGVTFAHDGEVGFCGTWTGITAARYFNAGLIDPARIMKMDATHVVRYSTGGTAALVPGNILTGGTSSKTCVLVYQIVENGTAGVGDSGWLFVKSLSGTFVAETLTATSTGTVVIYQNFRPILTQAPAKAALITVESGTIRFSISIDMAGTLASSSIGHQMTTGQSYVVRGWNNIKNFSAINDVNGNGAIVHYSLMY